MARQPGEPVYSARLLLVSAARETRPRRRARRQHVADATQTPAAPRRRAARGASGGAPAQRERPPTRPPRGARIGPLLARPVGPHGRGTTMGTTPSSRSRAAIACDPHGLMPHAADVRSARTQRWSVRARHDQRRTPHGSVAPRTASYSARRASLGASQRERGSARCSAACNMLGCLQYARRFTPEPFAAAIHTLHRPMG